MRSLKALISKKTINRAHPGNTYNYVIFPFGKDEQIICSMTNQIHSRDNFNFYIVDYDGFKKVYPFKHEDTKVFKSKQSRDELYYFIKSSTHNNLLKLCEDPNKLI